MDLSHLYQHDKDRTWLIRELRSDHAGETGAVWIYNGILAVSRDEEVREFSERHLKTEQNHLALMNQLLPADQRSRLLPIWKVAGFLTGVVPALIGARAVYATIQAVEDFVVRHYWPQVERLREDGLIDTAEILNQCMRDEMVHQREAQSKLQHTGPFANLLNRFVVAGSALAVAAARRI